MANFTLSIPELGSKFIDYRQAIPGDSFNWSWVRSLTQPKYLVIHHSAGPATQTPTDIANYHINHNGWGGVGYHFIITKDGNVYYVGDITTARANVANLNEQVIGICLVGDFRNGVGPTTEQINSAHLLCAHLLFKTPELPNINGWEDLVGHKYLNATQCPGDAWDNWRQKIVEAVGPVDNSQRAKEITLLYQQVLGRQPDQQGLQSWINGGLSIDKIREGMVNSSEHQQILNRAKAFNQVQSLASESLSSISVAYTKVTEITKL